MITVDTCADIFMLGSKTAPRLPTGSLRTGTITSIYGNTRNGDFRMHLWGTHDQHLCLVCIQFQFILRHPCIDVGEAVFQLSYTFVHYMLNDRFDRDVELCIIRISMEF